MKLPSQQYRGFLSCEQIAAGMSAATSNALRLAKDADLLLQAGRFPTAASLALLSLEESDKCRILRSMATAVTHERVIEIWRSYRRHVDKHALTLLLPRFRNGASRISDLKDCVTESGAGERQTYDAIKQLGLYTDCLGEAHWSVPDEVIDQDLATALVTAAKLMSKRRRSVTVRELELWVEHMQCGVTRQNLLAWAKAMESEGFEDGGYFEEMSRFTEGL